MSYGLNFLQQEETALTQFIRALEEMEKKDAMNAIIHKSYAELAKGFLEIEKQQLEKAREEGVRYGVESASKTFEKFKQLIFEYENINNPFTAIF